MRLLAALLLCTCAAWAAERRVILPPGAKPIGPYSPAIAAGGYLYVAGQGALDDEGRIVKGAGPAARRTLANIRRIVEAAGLTMEHIVYTQVYLVNVNDLAALDAVWKEVFPRNPPARAVLGVAGMPLDTPVEINAVAVMDLANKTTTAGGAVMTHDRYFLPGVLGQGSTPEAQVNSALDEASRLMKAAGLDLGRLVFVNPYLTTAVPMDVMNRLYAQRFESGYTPARATIRVASLPGGANFEITGVAVRDLKDRRVIRPRNMPPSSTASPCVFAADTLYCSAKAGFIPGPGSGVWAMEVEHQVRQTMRNLLDGLEEAGLDFSHVVATNVYLDAIGDFQRMNGVYGTYFSSAPPARTTVQQAPSAERARDGKGRAPTLEQVSLIAVR